MNPRDFVVQISPLSNDDGSGFLATVPDFPGCMSDGETPDTALRNAYDAIGSWFEAANELGRDIPLPTPVR